MNFQQRIEKLHDHLYANAGFRTPSALGVEVGKILHTAVFIEAENGGHPAFSLQFNELRALENGDVAFSSELAEKMAQKFSEMNSVWDLYPQEIKIELAPLDIGHVVVCLSNLLLSDPKHDYFGDALEIFRSTWAKREGGQFFTDQQVTRLSLDLLQFDPRKGDDLVDVCAGTGGFLLAALNRLRRLEEADNRHADEGRLTSLALQSLIGCEIDPHVASIASATLVARLSNPLSRAIVEVGDGLVTRPGSKIAEGRHRCIATNPPFGTKITVKSDAILHNYELARSGGRTVPRAPDTLFIERNLKLLKPGVGRAAIVTPFQIMSGPQALFIREWLLCHARIIAVVDLPADTFQPHTGTKASLLVFERRVNPLRRATDDLSGTVFMSTPQWIGHDRRGKTTYRTGRNGRATDEILTDIPQVSEAFNAYLRGDDPTAVHAYSYRVPLEKILDGAELRLNASFHAPGKLLSPGHIWTSSIRLGDVVERAFFPGRFRRNYVEPSSSAVPFLGGANITELVVNTHKWVSRSDPKYSELAVEPGWILLTRSGSTGIVSSVPESWDGFAISEHVIRIVPDNNRMPSGFLQAVLRSRYGQEYLQRGIFGSVIDEISPEYVLDMPIPLLKKEEIETIAKRMEEYEATRAVALRSIKDAMAALDRFVP